MGERMGAGQQRAHRIRRARRRPDSWVRQILKGALALAVMAVVIAGTIVTLLAVESSVGS